MENGDLPETRSETEVAGGADFRCGYVAICGYPNAGKSTLLNALLDERLAIVTRKPQTTRRRTLGILTNDGGQIIFVDTPGILEPRYELQGAMMRQVEQSIGDADVLLYVVDIRHPRIAPGVQEAAQRKPLIVALNKADLLRTAEEGLPAIEALRGEVPQAGFHAISALKGAGLPALLAEIFARLPRGPAFYPADQLTEHPERFFVAELIREAAFDRFHEEVPYSVEIELAEFREHPGRKDLIEAIVWVETESQKGILIGKGGKAIRGLGRQAREAIEAFLERPVFLELRVKVQPHWRRDAQALRRFGYPPPGS
ncbi:MAG: GTPase Era [Candidatus Eisenbacteria sp.]|nr:GTPase Era [Candidatus Eisenbacteria bacterium]